MRCFSTISALLLVATTVAPLRGVGAQETGFDIELPALTNGDVNGDWALDLSDPVYVLRHLFLGGPPPVAVLCGTEIAPLQNGDANGDGSVDISDAIRLFAFLFHGGPQPAQPCGSGGSVMMHRISFALVVTSVGAPESQKVTDGGITVTRNLPFEGTLSGDFEGTESALFNANLDAEGTGSVFGIFIFDGTWNGLTGTFEGRFGGRSVNTLEDVQFAGEGTGDFDGMRIMGRAVDSGDDDVGVVHDAVILVPARN